ncbi:hypothetical protein [Gracilimonas sp. BCB1]|uniref:hypothetical protein n=1 Tax=Gracilimonas sp. BCB1 TaxID=3152362 RepID=UPI0032D91371
MHNILGQLNDSSEAILSEIDCNEPSFEAIKSQLGQREELVKKLGILSDANPKESLSDEERISLRFLFDTFVELNDSIQNNLQNLLNSHKEKLGTAVNQRKVEKSYRVLKNPDISYFQP